MLDRQNHEMEDEIRECHVQETECMKELQVIEEEQSKNMAERLNNVDHMMKRGIDDGKISRAVKSRVEKE